MGRACCVVSEEWLLRCYRVLHAYPVNRMIREVSVENVIGIALVWFDWLCTFEQRRTPLIGIATDETVKVVKSEPCGPEIKRPGLAGLPVGNIMIFPVPRCGVSVLAQYL